MVSARVLLTSVLALSACSGPSTSPDPPTASAGFGNAPASSAAFTSPSGNIGCYVDRDGARCDIVKKSWKPPAKPSDCDLAWGSSISLTSSSSEPTFTCAGDTVLGAEKILNYGETIQVGDLRCDSTSQRIRCEDTGTGHGFTLAIEQYTIF
jgi:hypothetical protein